MTGDGSFCYSFSRSVILMARLKLERDAVSLGCVLVNVGGLAGLVGGVDLNGAKLVIRLNNRWSA